MTFSADGPLPIAWIQCIQKLRHHTMERHQNTHGVAYQTARTDLLGLVDKGIMRKVKKGKVFYFILEDDARNRLLTNERPERS